MQNSRPLISVVMPVYNAESFLREAVESILSQTYTNFEFIIINDGSTDNSGKILSDFNDHRMRVIGQPNAGIGKALNRGLDSASGELIARMDADDIALPQRFEKQVEFFLLHPDLALLGTWAEIIDSEGRHRSWHKHPTTNAAIKYALLKNSPFVHPSVMFRSSVIADVGKYDEGNLVFEDYDMWSRITRIHEAANLPEVLLKYREVSSSISRTTANFNERAIEQRRRNILYYLPTLPDDLVKKMAHIGYRHSKVTNDEFDMVYIKFMEIVKSFGVTDPGIFNDINKDIAARMMDFHLIPHTSILSSAMDRFLKSMRLRKLTSKFDRN